MSDPISAAYAAVSLFSIRAKPDIVLPLLSSLGDKAFVESFGSCFGKQRYSAFMDAAKEATFTPTKRCAKGETAERVL